MKGQDLRFSGGVDRPAVSMLTRKRRASIESDGYKLVTAGDDAEAELYDSDGDPSESRNVFADQPEVASRLLRELEAHIGRDAIAQSMSETAERLDTGTRKQLEALGYID
jgi:hypothetical protein